MNEDTEKQSMIWEVSETAGQASGEVSDLRAEIAGQSLASD